jgi:serine/threonine-protein kinase
VALKQVSEQARPPSQLNPQVSRALDAVVLRALAKDPANRFQSADEFIAALDAAEADPSGAGLGDTASYAPVAAGALAGAAAGAALGAAAADGAETAPPPERESGWMTRRRAALLAALALAAIAVAAWALTRTEQVRVPAVTGESVAEARAKLEGLGFEVNERPQPFCSPAGTVTEQDPLAQTEAAEGSEVLLTVSEGLGVRVPPLRNQPVARARERLEDADLLADTREQASRDIDNGRVITSEPPPGEQVECQSVVTLVVSTGANLVTLPDVLGDSQEGAVSELERLGFIVDVDTSDRDEPEGTVVGQDPGPGSRLLRGTRVTIVVSTGAGSVIVPDVEGQSESAAVNTLQSRGLSVDVVGQETDDQSEDGRVLEQAPGPGTRVRQGDTVTIFVGDFQEPVTIEPPEGSSTEDTEVPR